MTVKSFVSAVMKFLLGVVLADGLIFLSAGNLAFCNGWLLMGILFIPMFLAGCGAYMQKVRYRLIPFVW